MPMIQRGADGAAHAHQRPALWPAERGKPRRCGPAAIAIHDDGDVAR